MEQTKPITADISTKQEDSSEAQCFVNFNEQAKGGLLNDQWFRARKNSLTFNTALTIEKDGLVPVITHLMLVHSNIKKQTHLYRALYAPRLGDAKIKQQWPVFKCSQPQPNDLFEVQFCVKRGDIPQVWVNKSALKGTIGQGAKMVSITIKSLMVDMEMRYTVSIRFAGLSKEQELFSLMQVKDNDHFSRLREKIAGENEEVRKRLLECYNSNEQYYCFNDYSFLARDSLQDEKLYQRCPQQGEKMREELKEDMRLIKGEGDQSMVTLDQIRRYYQQKSQSQSRGCYEYFLKNIISWFKSRPQQYQATIQQGALGNCYLVTAIDQIISKASFILERVWIFQSNQTKTALAILNVDGRMASVKVDFNLFCKNNTPDQLILKYASFGDIDHLPEEKRYKNIVRAILLEKCLAKIFGGYQKLQEGLSEEVFMMLTNHNTKVYGVFGVVNNKLQRLPLQATKIKAIYIPVLLKWTEEMKIIDLKDKQGKQLKQFTYSHTSFQYKRPILDQYHFITFSAFDQDSLKKLFPEIQTNHLEKYCKHSYSFRGLFTPQSYIKTGVRIIKLRDLRGPRWAQLWKKTLVTKAFMEHSLLRSS